MQLNQLEEKFPHLSDDEISRAEAILSGGMERIDLL
jgi:hypothetical protein